VEGLAIIEPLRDDALMQSYHLMHAVRADFLFKLGRFREAKEELQKAVAIVRNESEKRMLEARVKEYELRSY
jgi:predicted RNA polymerase sigma factor